MMIGEPILRRNHGYPDEPQQWIKTICNETYLELMKEFPEDYRGEDGSRVLINDVKCDICYHQWRGLYLESTPQLQCPNCKQMAYHEVVNGG